MIFDDFSQERWLGQCELLRRNIQGLGMRILFRIEGGKGLIKFQGLDGKYKKAMTNLAFEVIHGALITLFDLIPSAGYAKDEDKEAQYALHEAEFKDRTQYYVQLLFDEGVEKMLEVFSSRQQMIEMSYELRHTEYRDGSWTLPNGDTYRDGSFMDHATGQPYHTVLTQAWGLLLSEEKSEEAGRA